MGPRRKAKSLALWSGDGFLSRTALEAVSERVAHPSSHSRDRQRLSARPGVSFSESWDDRRERSWHTVADPCSQPWGHSSGPPIPWSASSSPESGNFPSAVVLTPVCCQHSCPAPLGTSCILPSARHRHQRHWGSYRSLHGDEGGQWYGLAQEQVRELCSPCCGCPHLWPSASSGKP